MGDDADLRHDSVKRTVERFVQHGVIVQPPLEDEQILDAMLTSTTVGGATT